MEMGLRFTIDFHEPGGEDGTDRHDPGSVGVVVDATGRQLAPPEAAAVLERRLAGEGRTSSTLLAHAIFLEGLRNVVAG
jgi:hypothetical protein